MVEEAMLKGQAVNPRFKRQALAIAIIVQLLEVSFNKTDSVILIIKGNACAYIFKCNSQSAKALQFLLALSVQLNISMNMYKIDKCCVRSDYAVMLLWAV